MDRDAIRARAADACDLGEVFTVDKHRIGFGGGFQRDRCGTEAKWARRGCRCDACCAAAAVARARRKAKANA